MWTYTLFSKREQVTQGGVNHHSFSSYVKCIPCLWKAMKDTLLRNFNGVHSEDACSLCRVCVTSTNRRRSAPSLLPSASSASHRQRILWEGSLWASSVTWIATTVNRSSLPPLPRLHNSSTAILWSHSMVIKGKCLHLLKYKVTLIQI